MISKFYNIYKSGFSYYDIFFNIVFIILILIICNIIYWDQINKNSIKNSVCNNIKNIVEENSNNKQPYVYNIIAYDSNTIYNTNYRNFVFKITYNFKKQTTELEIKNIDALKLPTLEFETKNLSEIDPDYDELKSDDIDGIAINDLFTKYFIKSNGDSYTIEMQNIRDLKLPDNIFINKYLKNDSTYYILKTKLAKYYNLKTGQKEEITNIYLDDKNRDTLKSYDFICVDKDYKKIKTKTAKLLCKFTKEYLFNEFYNKSIINDINIANKKKYKVVL